MTLYTLTYGTMNEKYFLQILYVKLHVLAAVCIFKLNGSFITFSSILYDVKIIFYFWD